MSTGARFSAGTLRHRVTIRAPIGVLHETEPVDVATSVPMQIDVAPASNQSRERLDLGGLQTQTIYSVICRYREDVRPAYVLVETCCTRRTFQILAVIPSDRLDSTEMTCVTAG